MAVEGGTRLWTHAPSTMLRIIPLPRCTGETGPQRPPPPSAAAGRRARGRRGDIVPINLSSSLPGLTRQSIPPHASLPPPQAGEGKGGGMRLRRMDARVKPAHDGPLIARSRMARPLSPSVPLCPYASPSAPKHHARMPFCACRRFSASSNTTDCGPSITSSVTSSPRCTGRQCMKIASGAAFAIRCGFT